MKKLLTFVILLTINIINAQEFSYGVVFGNSFYEAGNNNGTDSFQAINNSNFYLGVYGEYNFTEKIGIKTEINLNKKGVSYQATRDVFNIKGEFEFKYLEIAPNFKYDFGQEYRKGFYMLAGPKLSFMTSATSDGEDVKDSFETFNVGAQLGFGYRVFKYVDLQTKLEYDISPFFKLDNGHKSNFFGAVVSANIDLAKLFSNE
jgi:hypothetical protein